MADGERFSKETRRQVHRDQHERCAYCGEKCDGKHKQLTVHHIWPQAFGGSRRRENAVGLCKPGCHDRFDDIAFKQGKTFDEVMQEEGRRMPRGLRRTKPQTPH